MSETNITEWLLTDWHTIYNESLRIKSLADDLIKGKFKHDLSVNLVYTLNGDTIKEAVGEIIDVSFNESNNNVCVKVLMYLDKMELYNLDLEMINNYKLPLQLPINVSVFNSSKNAVK